MGDDLVWDIGIAKKVSTLLAGEGHDGHQQLIGSTALENRLDQWGMGLGKVQHSQCVLCRGVGHCRRQPHRLKFRKKRIHNGLEQCFFIRIVSKKGLVADLGLARNITNRHRFIAVADDQVDKGVLQEMAGSLYP